MAFELNIKNIGKLDDAKIRIGQFTVFAGPNNTGKSTVSKLLYSLFDAMNVNHAEVYMQNLTRPVRDNIRRLMMWPESSDSDALHSFLREIENLENAFKDSTIKDIERLDKTILDLANKVEALREIFSNITMEHLRDSPFPSSEPEDILKDVEPDLAKLHEDLRVIDGGGFIISGIKYKVMENLTQNFQVPSLAGLQGKENAPSVVNIENIGRFEFNNTEKGIGFNIYHAGLRQLQQYSDVIYLESPVYWKLKNALEDLRINPRYRHRERVRLSGIPGYFYDLASAFKHEYTGDIAFPDLYERLTGKDVLGGKIAISESGDLSFQENGRSFSLPVTAMGVANLGILALLIERKILDEDSILFIDEPEAHLHPAWQVVMAETLFDLAKGGVNVVIATHSADILKWLEVHVKKNPEDEGMIALNKFPANGDDSNEQDFNDKIAAIKQELTKPFADLYMKGL